MRHPKQVVIVLLVALILVGLLSARKSPGDKLYFYKLTVNEPVIDFLQITGPRRAKYEKTRVDLRLREISQLILEKRVTEDKYTEWLSAFTNDTNAIATRVATLTKNGQSLISHNIAIGEKGIFEGYVRALTTLPVDNSEIRDKVVNAIKIRMAEHQTLVTTARDTAIGQYGKQEFIASIDGQFAGLDIYIKETNAQLAAAESQLPKEMFLGLQKFNDDVNAQLREAKDNRARDYYSKSILEANEIESFSKQVRIFLDVWKLGNN